MPHDGSKTSGPLSKTSSFPLESFCHYWSVLRPGPFTNTGNSLVWELWVCYPCFFCRPFLAPSFSLPQWNMRGDFLSFPPSFPTLVNCHPSSYTPDIHLYLHLSIPPPPLFFFFVVFPTSWQFMSILRYDLISASSRQLRHHQGNHLLPLHAPNGTDSHAPRTCPASA